MNRTPQLASLLTVLMEAPNVWAQPSSNDYFGQHMMWQNGWMLFGPLMMIAVIAIIVVAVVLLMRRSNDHRPNVHVSPDEIAIGILKQRFARGDIDKEEYEERRRTLVD
ncbi:unnamed protein product [Hapterophycus canaliculatus]